MGWVDPRVGLGSVGNRSTIFGELGRVMGLKWQICEKQVTRVHMKLCIVEQLFCFVNLSIMMSSENRTITYAGFEYLRILGNL